MEQAHDPKREIRWKAGLLLVMIAFYLMIMAFFGPWFNIHTEYTYCQTEYDQDFGLRETSNTFFSDRSGHYYSDVVERAEYKGMYQVFFATEIMVVLAILLTFLFCFFVIFLRTGSYRGRIFRYSGNAAICLSIFSVLFFAVAFPLAMEKHFEDSSWMSFLSGFFGTSGDPVMDPRVRTWGPGWAWYLMIISLVLNLSAVILTRSIAPKEDSDAEESSEMDHHREPPQSHPAAYDKYAVVIVIVPLIVFGFFYCFPIPHGQIVDGLITTFLYPTVVSSSEVHVMIGSSGYSSPTQYEVLLRNRTHQGIYAIPSSENETFLALKSGDDVGTIQYIDFLDNRRLDWLDEFWITELEPGTDYFIGLRWANTGSCINYETFSMPP